MKRWGRFLWVCFTIPLWFSACTTSQSRNTQDLLSVKGDFFSAAGQCSSCHSQLTDQDGTDISIDQQWQSSMMANSARDPYYLASVRSEMLLRPAQAQFIQDKCADCHIPMGFTSAEFNQESYSLLDNGYLSAQNPYFALSLDGVSCTQCHQMEDVDLGQPASFSGNYQIRSDTIPPRAAYGQFSVQTQYADAMQSVSAYQPLQSDHLGGSEFCAVCHTLYTPVLSPSGEPNGEMFPEQVPYLEWQQSDFAEEGTTCQNCHMPVVDGSAAIANSGSEKRAPFFQHQFAGANTLMPQVIPLMQEVYPVYATTDQFRQTQQWAEEQLKKLQLVVQTERTKDDQLLVRVKLINPAGHKFPSAFPSRRLWLHLQVRNDAGTVLFESGALQPDGGIQGNANDESEGEYEPHYERIEHGDQVQIYEAILLDVDGKVTTDLFSASGYLKDNRLLPAGFDKFTSGKDSAVWGSALEDESFIGGEDTLLYVIQHPDLSDSGKIQIDVYYQSIGATWRDKFGGQESSEADTFYAMLDQIEEQTVLLTQQTLSYSLP